MTRKSVSHTPYLRKHTSYDHDFWDTCKMMTSPGAFFIFSKFCFLGCWRGKRAKNGPKWQKKYVSLTRYLRNCTPYDCNFWYSCVKWWYLQWFFSFFFKILIFQVFRGVKEDSSSSIYNIMLQFFGSLDFLPILMEN